MSDIFQKIRNPLLSFGTLLLLWQAVVRLGNFPEVLLPSPLAVGRALAELAGNGTLFSHAFCSLYRFAAGYLLAVSSGAVAGLLLGWYPAALAWVAPVLHLLRPIAPVAWMPFIVLLIGIGDMPAIVIIFLAGFFPVLLSTAGAVRQLDQVYRRVAANYGIGEPAVLWKIVFPAVFPAVANSLHIALGSCWVFLVSGEMVGAQSGLGYMIVDARNTMRTDILLAAVSTIGVIGFLLDTAVAHLENRIVKLWGQH